MRKLLRTTIGLVVLVEALAFLMGAALHLGVSLPVPFAESRSLFGAAAEALSGIILLLAVAAIATREPRAWKLAVAGHVLGVAGIVWGIATGGSAFASQASHHPPMLLVLVVALIALSIPVCRQALENGRHRSRRRRRAVPTL